MNYEPCHPCVIRVRILCLASRDLREEMKLYFKNKFKVFICLERMRIINEIKMRECP